MNYYDDDDIDFMEDNPEEIKAQRIGRFRVAAGVMDFLSVIAGMAVVLVMIALLISLVNWLLADITQTFSLLQTRLK